MCCTKMSSSPLVRSMQESMQSLGLQWPTYSPSVSQEMSQHFRLPACRTVSSVVYLPSLHMLFLLIRLSAAAEVLLKTHAVWSCLRLPRIGYRSPTDACSVGVSTAVYDEAHWLVRSDHLPSVLFALPKSRHTCESCNLTGTCTGR